MVVVVCSKFMYMCGCRCEHFSVCRCIGVGESVYMLLWVECISVCVCMYGYRFECISVHVCDYRCVAMDMCDCKCVSVHRYGYRYVWVGRCVCAHIVVFKCLST